MKVSLKWLNDFAELPRAALDPQEIKRSLTGLGLGVESASPRGDDWVFDVEVTTNRPDCLSHYGIARELSAACRVPIKKIETAVKEVASPAADEVSIEVRDPDLCARYCGRVIRNVEVKPSPEWLTSRLAAVGARSINNVADITNYVLMELGHPLHAFDLDRLRQRQVLARRARAGEILKTLDGVERKLTTENLVIADAERPVALAGVMGGEDSGITAETTSVLLESAWFDPLSIRRTAKMQRMHTEASHRFERGADIEMAPAALNRAAALIKDLAGGEILRGLIDVYPQPKRREKIVLRRSEIRRVLGADISWENVERTLRLLGFEVERRGLEAWSVTPPSFRLDVRLEVDLIEEIARHFGYDRLPSRLVAAPPREGRDAQREKEIALAQTLVSLGYRQIITLPMTDPAEGRRFSDAAPVIIENPLSQEASGLRTTMIPSMIGALGWNLDRNAPDLKFFEIGKVYDRDADGKPRECCALALGITGFRRLANVEETAPEAGFFDLKGHLETIFAGFELPNFEFVAGGSDNSAIYEENWAGQFVCGGNHLAAFGRLAGRHAEGFKLRRPVWLAQVDLERLLQFPLRSKAFHAFSRFPAVIRDFSLQVPAGTAFQQIERQLRGNSPPELTAFTPLELFQRGAAGAGDYSLLLRVTFQSQDHTLSSDEIASLSQNVLKGLAALGIRLRG